MTMTSESVALAKLREAHKEEYDFYLKHAKKNQVEDWKDLPGFPVKLQMFCLSEYIEAALAIAEYEPEDDVIVARVPDVDAFYVSYGETYEEAKEMLVDAIHGCVELAMERGWEIPSIPGVETKTEIAEIHPAPGYSEPGARGRHVYMEDPDKGLSIPIPTHGDSDVPVGVIESILYQAGISREEWNSL